jgi:hypothetical protein
MHMAWRLTLMLLSMQSAVTRIMHTDVLGSACMYNVSDCSPGNIAVLS